MSRSKGIVYFLRDRKGWGVLLKIENVSCNKLTNEIRAKESQ